MEHNLAHTEGSSSLTEHSLLKTSAKRRSRPNQMAVEICDLSVVYHTIESLKPYPNNARTHSRLQIRKLRDSIEAFGFVNPVLIK
jgi:hypothetical protein